jgi:hypothetical protein
MYALLVMHIMYGCEEIVSSDVVFIYLHDVLFH